MLAILISSFFQLNHAFKPNCEYGGIIDSPRFGIIRAFYTNKAIKKGEELFISYGYPVETGPPWYRELYNKTIATQGEDGVQDVLEAIQKRIDAAKEDDDGVLKV